MAPGRVFWTFGVFSGRFRPNTTAAVVFGRNRVKSDEKTEDHHTDAHGDFRSAICYKNTELDQIPASVKICIGNSLFFEDISPGTPRWAGKCIFGPNPYELGAVGPVSLQIIKQKKNPTRI